MFDEDIAGDAEYDLCSGEMFVLDRRKVEIDKLSRWLFEVVCINPWMSDEEELDRCLEIENHMMEHYKHLYKEHHEKVLERFKGKNACNLGDV